MGQLIKIQNRNTMPPKPWNRSSLSLSLYVDLNAKIIMWGCQKLEEIRVRHRDILEKRWKKKKEEGEGEGELF